MARIPLYVWGFLATQIAGLAGGLVIVWSQGGFDRLTVVDLLVWIAAGLIAESGMLLLLWRQSRPKRVVIDPSNIGGSRRRSEGESRAEARQFLGGGE